MKKKTDGFSIKMKKEFSVEKDTTEEGLSIVSRLPAPYLCSLIWSSQPCAWAQFYRQGSGGTEKLSNLSNSWVRKIPWRRDWLSTPVFMGFPGSSDGKESACSVGDLGLIPGLGRSPGGGRGNPLQYSCLENPHGQRSLAGYSPWGRKESDTTGVT